MALFSCFQGVLEEKLEINQHNGMSAKLEVSRAYPPNGPLQVMISATGKAKRTQQDFNANSGADATTSAVQNKPKKAKTTGKRSAVGGAVAGASNVVINLLTDDEEEEGDVAADQAANVRLQVMKLMLSELSKAMRVRCGLARIPLSTAVQSTIAQDPPRSAEALKNMTISGLSNHMKQRFGPAILAGVVQADAHIAAVERGETIVESFQLNEVAALQGITASGSANGGGNGASGNKKLTATQQAQQQHTRPPAKRQYDDGDWDDFVDDDDEWDVPAAGAQAAGAQQQQRPAQPQQGQPWSIPAQQPSQATAPLQGQYQQQQYQNASFQQYNYAAAAHHQQPRAAPAPGPPGAVPMQHNGAAQPPRKHARLFNPLPAENAAPAVRNGGDDIPLAQRQLQLKTKLKQDVASHGRQAAQPRYQPGSAPHTMAVDDISNAFG